MSNRHFWFVTFCQPSIMKNCAREWLTMLWFLLAVVILKPSCIFFSTYMKLLFPRQTKFRVPGSFPSESIIVWCNKKCVFLRNFVYSQTSNQKSVRGKVVFFDLFLWSGRISNVLLHVFSCFYQYFLKLCADFHTIFYTRCTTKHINIFYNSHHSTGFSRPSRVCNPLSWRGKYFFLFLSLFFN